MGHCSFVSPFIIVPNFWIGPISKSAVPSLRGNQISNKNQHVSCFSLPREGMGWGQAVPCLHCTAWAFRDCLSVSCSCQKCKPKHVKQYHQYFSYAFALPGLQGAEVYMFSILTLIWSFPSSSLLFYQFSLQSDWFWGFLKIKMICCCFSQDYPPLCSIIRLPTKSTHTTATPSIF